MVEVVRSTVIDAPIEAVWQTLRDFNWHAGVHPAVAESHIEHGEPSDRVGAVRSFRLKGGEHVRERLLRLSDKNRSLSYAIVESDVPLLDYVAHMALKPVTDGRRTFWTWRSRFRTPPGRETELQRLVADQVYGEGFAAIRAALHGQATTPPTQEPRRGDLPATGIVVDRHGGPEVMRLAEISVPAPGPGEVRLRHTAIGVNFIDVYCRTGIFDLLKPPDGLGMEAAGIVLDVGAGVTHVRPGDRVGYACPPVGAYATVRTMDASLMIRLPTSLSDDQAAAGLLKGMSASFLLHEVHPVKRGDIVLVYAPAGGVGRLLCQWASHLGAHVIGATSSPGKVAAARLAGARDIVVPGAESLEDQVRRVSGGHGADVIFDAVGRDTFAHSLAALAVRGHLVSYGQASGPIGAYDIDSLVAKSATISRPNYGHYTDTPDKVKTLSARFFEMIERGIVTVEIGQRFPLARAADAHRALEDRATTGSTILTVEQAP